MKPVLSLIKNLFLKIVKCANMSLYAMGDADDIGVKIKEMAKEKIIFVNHINCSLGNI